MCRHVKIKATEEQLKNQGINCPNVREILLSGRAFPVEKVRYDGEKPKIFLSDPFPETQNIWVFEEFIINV
jgi:hypothetical protein